MNYSFLRTGRFWIAACITLLVTGFIFLWELDGLRIIGLPGPPRFMATGRDIVASVLITFLLSINVGLIAWQKRYGSCPRGTGGAAGGAGVLGFVALLCPVCIIVPISIAGISISLAVLAPFIPLFQIIAVLLLCVSFLLLVPKRQHLTGSP